MKITTIIIDDEADGREAIRLAIEKYCPDISVAGIYADPEDGLEGIKKLKPDLVFLDVQMPHLSGFDLLTKLTPVSFQVIFVSAYDQYAIKAIRFSALDYLLKPIDVEDLVRAVNKVKQGLENNQQSYQVESAIHNIKRTANKLERIAVPSAEGIDFFQVDDVVYCEAAGSYTTIYMKNGERHLVSRNLKDFENLLNESGFCRVHHSYLINILHVTKYIKGEGGYVILTGGFHVDISRRKKDEFLALLDKI